MAEPPDLSLVELPGVSNGEEKFDLKLDGTSATFIVPAGSEMVKLTLEQQNPTKFNSTSRYLVDDVTIYELNGSQDKRLSALFTAHQALNDFSVALAEHNLKALRAHSKGDWPAAGCPRTNTRRSLRIRLPNTVRSDCGPQPTARSNPIPC